MNDSGIYGIENISNGKWYVGQAVNLKKRFRDHKSKLRMNHHPNKHLQSAWNKYGEKSFVFRVLEVCEVDMLNSLEMSWVAKKDSYLNGYNNTVGGDGVRGLIMSKETRLKMSFSHKGHPVSDETRERMRETRKNSETARKHMKKLRQMKMQRGATPKEREHLARLNEIKKKPVLCVETGQRFESAHDAARKFGTYQSNISFCCNKPESTHRGFHWRYV